MLQWSESKVSRVETARIGMSLSDARAFATALHLQGDDLATFLALAEDAANTRGWWQAYRSVITTEQRMVADVETGARRIRQYASVTLPGLVQTPDYARSQLAWATDLGLVGGDIDAAVRIRMERQRVLAGPEPAAYDLVVEEDAIRRQVAAPALMVTQLSRLIALTELSGVRIRIVPTDTRLPRPPAAHPFQLIEFRDPNDPTVVSVESLVDLRYLTEPQQVSSYDVLFERTWRAALSEAQTIAWLRSRAQALHRAST